MKDNMFHNEVYTQMTSGSSGEGFQNEREWHRYYECSKDVNAYKGSDVFYGLCLSDKDGYVDVAFTLHSRQWISIANQWVTRSNSSWPSSHVKSQIIDHGVLSVTIGSKGSKNEHIEWRISFFVGEQILMHSFTITQLLCYALMKFFIKDVANMENRCKDLICSFYIKNIIFWVSEEISLSIWCPENLISCFMRCFRRLIYCLEYFFITLFLKAICLRIE